jgi:hypothetical protein
MSYLLIWKLRAVPHLEPHLHSATEALLPHIMKLTNLPPTGAFIAMLTEEAPEVLRGKSIVEDTG